MANKGTFAKGDKRAGRRSGSKNKRTLEAEELAARLIDDPAYQRSAFVRIQAGKAAHLETLIWHYRYGVPKQRVDLGGSVETIFRWAKPEQ